MSISIKKATGPSRALPLLASQTGMWLEEQRHASAPAHIVSACLKVRGPLDRAALQVSIDRLVARHENLRVTFNIESGGPKQWVHDEIDTQIVCIDLRGAGQTLDSAIHRALMAPMSLESGPLFRVTLFGLGADENALLFAIHHLVADHQSTDRLLQDFYALYQVEVTGGPNLLAPLATSYSSHVQAAAESGAGEPAKAYWRHEMASAPVPLVFATGMRRAPTGLRSTNAVIRPLDAGSAMALRQLGQGSGATSFMVHLATCAVLMQRHTGANDIVFGVPLSTRADASLQSLAGLFVNTLPLRLRFAPETTFEALLRLVRARLLRAMMHVGLPLHELIGMLQLERHAGSNPLFQVCVNHAMSTAPDRRSAGGCEFGALALPTLKAAFEVNIILLESASDLAVCFEFDEDVLSVEDAEDILDQYQSVLVHAAAMPSQAVLDLRLLDAPAPQASTAAAAPFDPVHARIERQAALTPDAVAIVCGGQRLTYAELEARAGQLASRLIEHGITRGSLVAVCTDRRPELVVAVLAVLKAGGAYVPVDQDNPDERLRFILEDTQARVLLTSKALLQRFANMPAQILCADEEAAPDATRLERLVGVATGPDDLVYCVYTSGSTGQPKGALNTHRGFANLLDWYTGDLSMRPHDRVMLASSFGFDMTQKSLLGPLCVGAQLVMPACSPAEHLAFTQALATHAPTWLSCAPSAYRSFMEAPAAVSIGTLVLGGEPLPASITSALRGRPVKLVNSYGPSECSDIAIWCERSMQHAEADDTAMPLGQPVRNVHIHLLDDRLQPVPVGVPGDLYIAGAGVGRGYLRRPDLTAAYFLPDPFGAPGSRMYKTGDIARRRRDGVLEYLGRADDQIKVRGNRVEPGEVERCLRACAGVKEAVVMLRELAGGDSHLVGYVVSQEQEVIDTDSMRRELRRQLPDYMVPTAWMTLPALPLNLNGKVDRKALPLPLRESAAQRTITAPRTSTEARLADIWKTVLNLPEVCVFDNFFDLWGQSLLAVKVIAMVAEQFGVALPTRAIFDAENLAALAAQIDQAAAQPAAPTFQPIKRQARQPVAHGQARTTVS